MVMPSTTATNVETSNPYFGVFSEGQLGGTCRASIRLPEHNTTSSFFYNYILSLFPFFFFQLCIPLLHAVHPLRAKRPPRHFTIFYHHRRLPAPDSFSFSIPSWFCVSGPGSWITHHFCHGGLNQLNSCEVYN